GGPSPAKGVEMMNVGEGVEKRSRQERPSRLSGACLRELSDDRLSSVPEGAAWSCASRHLACTRGCNVSRPAPEPAPADSEACRGTRRGRKTRASPAGFEPTLPA